MANVSGTKPEILLAITVQHGQRSLGERTQILRQYNQRAFGILDRRVVKTSLSFSRRSIIAINSATNVYHVRYVKWRLRMRACKWQNAKIEDREFSTARGTRNNFGRTYRSVSERWSTAISQKRREITIKKKQKKTARAVKSICSSSFLFVSSPPYQYK